VGKQAGNYGSRLFEVQSSQAAEDSRETDGAVHVGRFAIAWRPYEEKRRVNEMASGSDRLG